MRFLGAFLFAAIALTSGVVSAEETATSARPEPFRQLRDAKLEYHGPSDDFADLTELRIGWFGPTDGDDPANGGLWWAANLAIEEANAHLTTSELPLSDFARLPFRLVPRWTADPWGSGITLLTRMVFDEQPLALLGSVDSATTHLAEQIVAKAQLPLVSPIATDKTATLAGVSWMFSCAPADDAIARVLVDAILTEVHAPSTVPAGASLVGAQGRRQATPLQNENLARDPTPRLVLLATTDHESRMSAREVERELGRRGRRPDFRFEVSPGAADITHQLQAVAEARPEIVLIIAGVEDAARLTQAVRAQTDTAIIFGNQSMARRRFSVMAGSAAEGVRFPLLFVPNPDDTNVTRFVERFSAAYHCAPDYTEAFTYDATRMLIEAIRRAGPNRARIREALIQLSPWSGIAGPIHFDGTGQNQRATLPLGTIRDGKIVPIGSAGSYERGGSVGSYERERVDSLVATSVSEWPSDPLAPAYSRHTQHRPLSARVHLREIDRPSARLAAAHPPSRRGAACCALPFGRSKRPQRRPCRPNTHAALTFSP